MLNNDLEDAIDISSRPNDSMLKILEINTPGSSSKYPIFGNTLNNPDKILNEAIKCSDRWNASPIIVGPT